MCGWNGGIGVLLVVAQPGQHGGCQQPASATCTLQGATRGAFRKLSGYSFCAKRGGGGEVIICWHPQKLRLTLAVRQMLGPFSKEGTASAVD